MPALKKTVMCKTSILVEEMVFQALVYTEKLESAETFLQVKPILHRLKTVLMEK